LRHEAAEWNTRPCIEQRERGVEHRAANVLEVDVDAAGGGRGEPATQVGRPMVHARIEAEGVHGERAFLRATSDTNDPAAKELPDLANGEAQGLARRLSQRTSGEEPLAVDVGALSHGPVQSTHRAAGILALIDSWGSTRRRSAARVYVAWSASRHGDKICQHSVGGGRGIGIA
jgi:hypothetical protein